MSIGKTGNKFLTKCLTDLWRPWEVGLVVLCGVGLSFLYRQTAFRTIPRSLNEIRDNWMQIHFYFRVLAKLYLFFCIILGAGGIGEELSRGTVRLWLLRPRSRSYFLIRMNLVGMAAVSLLFVVLVLFYGGAWYFLGSPNMPAFRWPHILLANTLLGAVALFAVSRLLTFLFQSARAGILGSLVFVIGLPALAEFLPREAAKLIPNIESLLDGRLVVWALAGSKPWPYPTAQAWIWAGVSMVCFLSEILCFRRTDIHV